MLARPAILCALSLAIACTPELAPTLDLPDRPSDSPSGSELARSLRGLDREEREVRVLSEVVRGNVPSWLRDMRPVRIDGTVTFWAAPDYLAIGSDTDFLRIPLTPQTAQRIADATGTSLPTTRMVDAIWNAAQVRLGPTPIPPNRLMTTIPVFEDHQRKVERQRRRARAEPGALVAGHKKDVVLTNELAERPEAVAIYGWHYLDGRPIQRLYLGHTNDWVDYSHGIRLVDDSVTVGRERRALADVLVDRELAGLLSSEGAMSVASYPR